MPRALLTILVSALFMLIPAGCAASGTSGTDLLSAERPGDFTLGLAVLGPAGRGSGGQQPARYVVGADGWLRSAVGPGSRESVYPLRTRYLSASERDGLWDLVTAAEVASIEPPLRIQSPESFDAPAGRRVYLVQLTANGQRVSVAVPEGEPETPGIAAIADRLAGWSWVQP